MLKPEQVPDTVAETLLIWATMREGMNPKELVAAALNAWPGMQTGSDDGGITLSGVYLPMPTEASDD